MAVYLILLLILLFAGAKIASKNEFHEDFLSLKIAKGIQGACAVAIIFHHFVQDMVTAKQNTGIMFIFHDAGYLLVAIFFFFSGYGLYVSYKNKADYLNGFLKKRLPTVLVPLFIINAIYFIVYSIGGKNLYGDLSVLSVVGDNLIIKITSLLCLTPMNGNSWFVITISIFYIMFYLIFKHSKNEDNAVRNIGIMVLLYAVLGICLPPNGPLWFEGEWWYDSSFIFFIGIFAGKNEKKILDFAKRKYKILLSVSLIGTAVTWFGAVVLDRRIGAYGHGLAGAEGALVCYLAKTVVEILFISFVLLLAMKIKANNKILDFLGKIAFEVYLIHGLFKSMFESEALRIENPIVCVLVILVCTIISACILKKIDSMLVKSIKGLSNNNCSNSSSSSL